jgi:heme A synthase
VALLILGLAYIAFRRLRDHRWLVRGVVAAGVLVLLQAGLGGLTVEHGLHTALVAAHLGLAMLLLGLLIALRRLTQDGERAAPLDTSRALRITAIVATVLLFATIVAGGYVAGTEEEGTPSEPAIGAHLACGTEFPTCLGKFMPFSYGRLVDIQLTHRLFMYLTAIAILAMTAIAVRRRVVLPPNGNRAFLLIPLLLVCQILLGAVNVWEGKHAWLVVSHLTLGTILWGTVVYATSSLIAVPEASRAPRPDESGGTRETQAVTA